MQSFGLPMKTRTAVILVAGVGSRLRPLTDDRPKALVEVGGETLLGRAVRILAAYGVEHLVLATGYREDAVRAAMADASVEVSFCPNPRYDTTQNSVSLALCRDAVKGAGFFKLDGDVLFPGEVLERVDACAAPLAAAVDQTRRLDAEAMKVKVEGSTRIARFGKGLGLAESAGESIGIERISADAVTGVFDALDRALAGGRTDLYYEDVYSQLIEQGGLQAEAVPVGDLPWTEIDDRQDLDHARRLLADLPD